MSRPPVTVLAGTALAAAARLTDGGCTAWLTDGGCTAWLTDGGCTAR
ncbi:hypothetical protein ACQPZJ_12320 [Actinoplanes sp. CA-054009]